MILLDEYVVDLYQRIFKLSWHLLRALWVRMGGWGLAKVVRTHRDFSICFRRETKIPVTVRS